MDPWELFSSLCKRVVEEQNVYLDILITPSSIEMVLCPYEEEEEEEEE